MPKYRCPSCGRETEKPAGRYYCSKCGPSAIMVEGFIKIEGGERRFWCAWCRRETEHEWGLHGWKCLEYKHWREEEGR